MTGKPGVGGEGQMTGQKERGMTYLPSVATVITEHKGGHGFISTSSLDLE